MKKLPNKYDFIAKMFTNHDPFRPAICKPGEIDNLVYATDAHTAVRFDKLLANMDYSENVKFPNAKSVFENLDLYKTEQFTTDQLLEKIYHCQVVYNNNIEKCEDCDGDGTCECSKCGNEGECKECDGSGTIELVTPYAGITVIGPLIIFLEKAVLPKFIYKVIECALILKEDTISVKYSLQKMQLMFNIGKVEILVMATYQGND